MYEEQPINVEKNQIDEQTTSVQYVLNDVPVLEPEKKGKAKGLLGMLGVAGLVLVKFAVKLKFLFVFFKLGKFLTTLLSMGVTIALYASFYGIWFAIGFVALIFCHEMGHYVAAQLLGIEVSAPLFIPFVGAMISLKESPKTAEQEALMAVGGPAAGILASFFCLGIYGVTGIPLFSALAYIGLFMNLFNLIPVHPLDGGRISVAVTPWLWAIGIPIGIVAAFKFHSIILIMILILGGIEAYKGFKGEKKEYFSNVSKATRIAFGIGYLAMIMICGVGMMVIFANHMPQNF